jgi:hypothetical protein
LIGIEQLTEEERIALKQGTATKGEQCKALRIIDAQGDLMTWIARTLERERWRVEELRQMAELSLQAVQLTAKKLEPD